ncbi:MAG TPA: hypothetical protein PL110_09485 [Candidatus Eremiobacteraeota bacterium]|nr:MAG: hypothetical protein BWY64_02008 [bacterium ADurb.Bin363]HPZ08334.1 hypothetical protein [Candidatus Eremiobacteraeota bacterium]
MVCPGCSSENTIKKGNKQWIWLAMDAGRREITGLYAGSRNREGACGLWKSLSGVYRQCAIGLPIFMKLAAVDN